MPTSTSPDRNARNRSSSSPHRPAYTLTACIRCRERKSRCDASLPRCTQCEKSGQPHCEYWDAAKRKRLPRSHIVRLKTEVEKLEAALAQYDIHDDLEPEDEDLLRDAAVVEFRDTSERKFLGSSSGTTVTRLVMRLAKQVLGVKSINDVISAERIRQIDMRVTEEEARPTSRIFQQQYPLFSSYAEINLPGKDLCDVIVQLFNLQVQSMYPMFHEPSLPFLFDEVLNGTRDAAKNFIVRMIIAIGLQRLETKWAGVADSYYLGALTYFEDAVRAMNLQTLQCCILIGEYSLLTPTRTAAWYIVGLGVRLAQQLGLAEERTILLNETGQPASPLEVDIKRRAFWAIVTMDYGLAHSLGRPAAMATDQEHFNVKYFLQIDDECITHSGVKRGPLSIRKWIAVHFYNMRLLQLEIRRKLYRKKQPTPTSDSDEWFKYMEKKMEDWRNATPSSDAGSGFSETWFKGRYNTIIVLLYRPSPQIPRPSARAAILCYDACEENIYVQRKQLDSRSVELTWVFAQAIFLSVNTILWTLAYVEVRQRRSQEEVRRHLNIAIDGLVKCSERWPGVASAVELYEALSSAILQIYDREVELPIQSSPHSSSDTGFKSQTPSPNLANVEIPLSALTQVSSFGSQDDRHLSTFQPILPSNSGPDLRRLTSSSIGSDTFISPGSVVSNATANAYHASFASNPTSSPGTLAPQHQFNALPSTYSQLDNWQFSPTTAAGLIPGQPTASSTTDQWPDFENENGWNDWAGFADGIDQARQNALLRDLETNGGIDQIENIVHATTQFWGQMSRAGSTAGNL